MDNELRVSGRLSTDKRTGGLVKNKRSFLVPAHKGCEKNMGENDLVLKVTDVSKSFSGVQVLNRIQFELKKGEVHALLGEMGRVNLHL